MLRSVAARSSLALVAFLAGVSCADAPRVGTPPFDAGARVAPAPEPTDAGGGSSLDGDVPEVLPIEAWVRFPPRAALRLEVWFGRETRVRLVGAGGSNERGESVATASGCWVNRGAPAALPFALAGTLRLWNVTRGTVRDWDLGAREGRAQHETRFAWDVRPGDEVRITWDQPPAQLPGVETSLRVPEPLVPIFPSALESTPSVPVDWTPGAGLVSLGISGTGAGMASTECLVDRRVGSFDFPREAFGAALCQEGFVRYRQVAVTMQHLEASKLVVLAYAPHPDWLESATIPVEGCVAPSP